MNDKPLLNDLRPADLRGALHDLSIALNPAGGFSMRLGCEGLLWEAPWQDGLRSLAAGLVLLVVSDPDFPGSRDETFWTSDRRLVAALGREFLACCRREGPYKGASDPDFDVRFRPVRLPADDEDDDAVYDALRIPAEPYDLFDNAGYLLNDRARTGPACMTRRIRELLRLAGSPDAPDPAPGEDPAAPFLKSASFLLTCAEHRARCLRELGRPYRSVVFPGDPGFPLGPAANP